MRLALRSTVVSWVLTSLAGKAAIVVLIVFVIVAVMMVVMMTRHLGHNFGVVVEARCSELKSKRFTLLRDVSRD